MPSNFRTERPGGARGSRVDKRGNRTIVRHYEPTHSISARNRVTAGTSPAGLAGNYLKNRASGPTPTPITSGRILEKFAMAPSQEFAVGAAGAPCRRDAIREIPRVQADRFAGSHLARRDADARAALVQRRSAGRQPGAHRSDERGRENPHVGPAAGSRVLGNRGWLSGGLAAGLRLHSPYHR